MVATYFNKGKGRTGPVEYVLDKERVESGEAKLLRGDAQITADLIKTNNNELKYRSGVLAFTEKDLAQGVREQIMDDFEKSTFAGMNKSQYNILWVEHQDKGNLELHFVIPRLELTTGKAYNPHWHKADQDRLLLFQDIQNAKYNLTNPYEAERANALQMPTKWDNRSKAKEEINDVIVQGVSSGQLQNREQIVEFLENSGLEVKRSAKGKLSKNFIAVKSPEDKDYIRLKGAYYNEDFRSAAEVEKQLTTREQRHSFTTPEQLRKAEQRLDSQIQKRAEFNNGRYQRAEQKQDISQGLNINNDINSNHRDNERSVTSSTSISHEAENDINKSDTRAEQVADTRELQIRDRGSKVHTSQQRQTTDKQEHSRPEVHQNRGIDENRIRAAARTAASENTEAITKQREERNKAYTEARTARTELFKRITEDTRAIQARAREYQQDQQKEQHNNIRESETITRTAEQAIRTVNKFTRAIEVIRGYKDKCVEYIKDAREYLKEKYNEYIRGYNELPYKLQETADIIKSTSKEVKPELSFKDVEKFRDSINNSIEYSNEKVQTQQRSQNRGYSMSK